MKSKTKALADYVKKNNAGQTVDCYRLPENIVSLIWIERLRQRDLLRHGKIPFDCASPIVSHDRKYRVLGEEYGEVARAIDLLERAEVNKRPLGPYVAHLREELIQTAAVAIAWLESLEGK